MIIQIFHRYFLDASKNYISKQYYVLYWQKAKRIICDAEMRKGMKFLLIAINAKYIHSNPAIYSLKAYAGAEYENEIEITEYTINNRMEDILSDIYKRKPDAAAFSCYIWNWRIIRELTAELHKVMPLLPIWLGGPEVSFDAEIILKEHGE